MFGPSLHVHLMQMIGWLMIALFVWLFHGPWLAFKRAVDAEDWPSASASSPPNRHIRLATHGRSLQVVPTADDNLFSTSNREASATPLESRL